MNLSGGRSQYLLGQRKTCSIANQVHVDEKLKPPCTGGGSGGFDSGTGQLIKTQCTNDGVAWQLINQGLESDDLRSRFEASRLRERRIARSFAESLLGCRKQESPIFDGFESSSKLCLKRRIVGDSKYSAGEISHGREAAGTGELSMDSSSTAGKLHTSKNGRPDG